MINGGFLIYKEKGFTSRDIVNIISKKIGSKKVGHIGTLDPFAEGLLIVLVNKSTKLVPYLESANKTYIATLQLGSSTTTLDCDGEEVMKCPTKLYRKDEIVKVLDSFTGVSEQIPPMYSALKYEGKELYKYAREGIEIERKSRKIEIFDIELISYSNDLITFKTTVSKGTYIRTLGSDIAKKLGTCGHLIGLTRERINNFDIQDSVKIKEFDIEKVVTPFELVSHMNLIKINDEEVEKAKVGKRLVFETLFDEVCLVSDEDLVAIYEREENNVFKSKRGLF